MVNQCSSVHSIEHLAHINGIQLPSTNLYIFAQLMKQLCSHLFIAINCLWPFGWPYFYCIDHGSQFT